MILQPSKKKKYEGEKRNEWEEKRKAGSTPTHIPLLYLKSQIIIQISENADKQKYLRKEGPQIYKSTVEGQPSKWGQKCYICTLSCQLY